MTEAEQSHEPAWHTPTFESVGTRVIISFATVAIILSMVTPLHEWGHCVEQWIRTTTTDPCEVVYYHPMERGPGGLLGAAWTETSHYTHVWMWRLEAVAVFAIGLALIRWTTAPLRQRRPP